MKAKKSKILTVASGLALTGILAAAGRTITIDGEFGDWNAVAPIAKDGKEGLAPCDWREARATHDALYWFVQYTCQDEVDQNLGAAYNIYIDTDRKRTTGYRGGTDEFPLGAEYLVQGGCLFIYDGSGTSWVWVKKAALAYAVDGRSAEVSVPLAMIGNPDQIFFFLHGDNFAIDQSEDDTCPDNALQPKGQGPSLRYSFMGE